MAATLLDTVAIIVEKIIGNNTKQNAGSGLLNYVMRFYSSSLKAPIVVTVQSASCLFQSIQKKTALYSCCGKIICNGCRYADNARQYREKRLSCPFCRHSLPETQEDTNVNKNLMKRAEANDPAALLQMGVWHSHREEYDKTFEYYTRGSELGDADAHYNLSLLYMNGQGVEKDETKEIYHMEEAAIRGNPRARFNLGVYEWRNDKKSERAVKHWIIAANLGHDDAIQALMNCYKDGVVSKDDFAAALRAHHAAVNATKSPQREAAARAIAGASGKVL